MTLDEKNRKLIELGRMTTLFIENHLGEKTFTPEVTLELLTKQYHELELDKDVVYQHLKM